MPTIPHVEKHFTGSASVRDVADRIYRSTTVKSALRAGFDGRDQPGYSTLNPSEWGVGLYIDQGDTCASVLPFFFLKPPA